MLDGFARSHLTRGGRGGGGTWQFFCGTRTRTVRLLGPCSLCGQRKSEILRQHPPHPSPPTPPNPYPDAPNPKPQNFVLLRVGGSGHACGPMPLGASPSFGYPGRVTGRRPGWVANIRLQIRLPKGIMFQVHFYREKTRYSEPKLGAHDARPGGGQGCASSRLRFSLGIREASIGSISGSWGGGGLGRQDFEGRCRPHIRLHAHARARARAVLWLLLWLLFLWLLLLLLLLWLLRPGRARLWATAPLDLGFRV